jgi:hypothetical protein
MLHGLIFAQYAEHLGDDPGADFADEVRTYFASGTQLQEMYITPSLLKDKDWDAIAEGAKWSQANKETLRDTHWVGGDPLKLQVYGWASWSKKGGIICLRNPSDHPQSFSIEPDRVFELPKSARTEFTFELRPTFNERSPGFSISKGASEVVTLAPFEVRIYESVPKR